MTTIDETNNNIKHRPTKQRQASPAQELYRASPFALSLSPESRSHYSLLDPATPVHRPLPRWLHNCVSVFVWIHQQPSRTWSPCPVVPSAIRPHNTTGASFQYTPSFAKLRPYLTSMETPSMGQAKGGRGGQLLQQQHRRRRRRRRALPRVFRNSSTNRAGPAATPVRACRVPPGPYGTAEYSFNSRGHALKQRVRGSPSACSGSCRGLARASKHPHALPHA